MRLRRVGLKDFFHLPKVYHTSLDVNLFYIVEARQFQRISFFTLHFLSFGSVSIVFLRFLLLHMLHSYQNYLPDALPSGPPLLTRCSPCWQVPIQELHL